MTNRQKKELLIILPAMRNEAPYLENFISLLEKDTRWSWHLVCWPRYMKGEIKPDERETVYFSSASTGDPQYKKMIDYWRFASFARGVIRKRKPDCLLLVSIQLLVFMALFIKFCRIPYMLDIRDPSSLWKYTKFFLTGVVCKARQVFISSPAYRSWLPETSRICLSHNTTRERLELATQFAPFEFAAPYSIMTVGQIRFSSVNIPFVRALQHDDFLLSFIGKVDPNETQAFKAIENCPNVSFTGYYEKSQEMGMIAPGHFIAILTAEGSKTCMANRLYLALVACKALIANEQTITAEYIEKYNLGVVVSADMSDAAEKIRNYAEHFSPEMYMIGRNRLLTDIRAEIDHFEKTFLDILSEAAK